MREQLEQYVNLLFAGATDCEDIRQEILQNTLDRYDDLIAEGKVPEAAYRLAITGIGDVNEILGVQPQASAVRSNAPVQAQNAGNDTPTKKLMRAIAIGLYILCPIPLIVLSELGMDTLGLCALLVIVAVATVLIILGAKKDTEDEEEDKEEILTPKQELRKSIHSLIWGIGLAVYFGLSFVTGAWHITWLVFPIISAVKGLVNAILDLKEAQNHEI